MASLHPDDRYRVIELYKKQVKTGLFHASYRILRKDGCVRWVHTRASPIYNKQNVLYRSAGVTEDITEHMNSIQKRTEYAINIRRGFNELVVAISKALELRDAYTAGHQNKVSYLAKAIAEELHLPTNQVESIEIAALLHDIGKIGVPLDLLSKPSKLSNIEYELIKKHAEAGYDILKGIHFPWPIAEIVRQHHERLDGSGYQRGLKSDNIMLEAKIIASMIPFS